jgi:hypothetical protein
MVSWEGNVSTMMQIKVILLSGLVIYALFFIDKRGLLKNPIGIAAVILLLVLGYPLCWRIKEYIKKKYPQVVAAKKCPFCSYELAENATNCNNCGKPLGIITIDDKFAEDAKVKKICPYCGLKELETVYEISKGYREVCASCGKSRVSRRAIKLTFYVIAFIIAYIILLLLGVAFKH